MGASLLDLGHVAAVQPLGRRFAGGPEALGLKGIVETGGGDQLPIGAGAGQFHEGVVPLPGLGPVLLHEGPELQSHGLGQAVVDVGIRAMKI